MLNLGAVVDSAAPAAATRALAADLDNGTPDRTKVLLLLSTAV